jgi:hypothetical protein
VATGVRGKPASAASVTSRSHHPVQRQQRPGGKQILTMILDIRCTLLIIDIKYWDWDGWPPNCRAKSLFIKVFSFSGL